MRTKLFKGIKSTYERELADSTLNLLTRHTSSSLCTALALLYGQCLAAYEVSLLILSGVYIILSDKVLGFPFTVHCYTVATARGLECRNSQIIPFLRSQRPYFQRV